MNGFLSRGFRTVMYWIAGWICSVRPVPGGFHTAGLAVAVAFLTWMSGQLPAAAASLPSGFVETEIASYWDEAAGLVFDSANVMYVWDRQGRVWIVENDVKRATPLIDISEEVGAWNDYGLLGFALHPNFRENGYIYLLYVVDHHHLTKFGTPNYSPTQNEYQRATIGRLTRYTARASDNFHSVDPASRTVLIGQGATNGFPILYLTHGVGSLIFGTDGTLLVSCGEGAALSDSGSDPESFYVQGLSEGIIRPKENIGAFRSQMVDSLSGKILRIDPDTGEGIPSNPFYDPADPRAPRSRVWALGLRNPCRITLRPGTGSHSRADANPGVIYVGDVGYFTWEEQSVVTGPGMNFGWPIFEGFSPPPSYDGTDPANLDAPNPLFGIGGCSRQYFTFRDLLKEATLGTPSWPNPCNSAQQVPASIPHFVHSRPAIDWMHGSGPSRVGIFSGNNASTINVGAGGSPVSGPQFGGNCSIGGTFYQGDDFPATYKNTYFQGDLGNQWIKNFVVDTNDNLVSVRDFASNAGGVVFIGTHPVNGTLYYIDFFGWLRRVTYVGGGNRPPVAVASANLIYGPGPLTVQFAGSGSSDPDGNPLTYRWNFGDGSAVSTAANPSHTFNAPAGVPTRYDVTLTVTDTSSASNTATLIISVNNTPPNVTVTSPAPGTVYSMSGQTTYNLTADVTDSEQTLAQLSPRWQVVLHHNNHVHPEPVDTNWSPTVVISPLGCDGDTYFYRFTLTVTDAAGLVGSSFVDVSPNCTSNAAPTISDIQNQTIAEGTSTGPLGFTVGDLETAPGSLTVSGGTSNPTLVPAGNIGFGGSGASRTVTVTPAAGQSGTATITVTVSDGSASASDVFVLSVNPANNTPPTISDISNFTINEDASTGPIAFTIGDAETAAGSLTLTRASSNPTLVPTGNIVFGGSGANRTVAVTPAGNQAGSTTITVTVSDGVVSTSDTFVLTVNPVNDLPTISDIADLTIAQNTATGPLNFTVGDIETAAGSLVVSGTSSNPSLVAGVNIIFGGSGASRTVTVTPLAGQIGTATITVSVDDGSAVVSDTFVLTVTAVVAPTYLFSENFEGSGYENTGWIESGTPNEDYTTTVLSGTQSLNCNGAQSIRRPFSHGTSFNAYFQARWVTYSAYQAFVAWTDPNWNLVIEMYCNNAGGPLTLCHGGVCATGTTPLNTGTTYHFWVEWTQGTGANGTLKLFVSTTGTKPASSEISITTGTGGATSQILFGPQSSGNVILDRLLVDDVPIGSNPGSPANTAPTISDITNRSVNEDAGTGPISFTVGDAETAAGSLTVTGSSSNPTVVPNANIVLGGSGPARTVTVTPAANQSGSATITVSVSDGSLSAGDTFILTVNAVNDVPTISNIADRSVAQDASTGPVAFTVGDVETAAASLVLGGSSSNQTLVPDANIVFGGSGSNRTIAVTPVSGQAGTATITVTVGDGTDSAADTFVLTVVVNTAPTISEIGDQSVNEDTALAALAFTVGDAETAAGSLVVSGTSSSPTLVPTAGIVFGGSGANRNVSVTPAADQSGTATITVTVSDGITSASDTFVLTVNAVNDAPTISNITDRSIVQDTTTGPISFTVGDVETAAGSLTVSGGSSNPTVVPDANIVFGGTGASRTVTVTPAAGQIGTATITMTVGDGAVSASDTFVLSVTSNGNTAPTISDIADRSINEDANTGAIAYTIGDAQTAAGSLTLSRSSSNPTLVPVNNIVFGGSGASRTVTLTPVTNQSGTATITVTVSDGSLSTSDTFLLTVNAVNDAPTISNIANRSTLEDTSTGPIAFTIGDVDNLADSLVLTAASSNPTRVPVSNIVFGGSGTNRTVTVLPGTNQSGSATITITVSDGALIASDPFTLTITAVNDAPTLSDITDRSVAPGVSTGPIAFTIGDVETIASSLTLSRASSNPTLVPTNNITFGGSGANRTVTVSPAAGQSGTATITVTVSDGSASTGDTFVLAVNAPNNTAPTISDISDLTINEDAGTGSIGFTIGDAETAAGSLVLTRASSNPTLVPTNNIVFGGSGASRTVTVTPAANQSGTATITVTVSDGALSASDTFLLNVNAVNDVPTISNIADQTIAPDTAAGPLNFTIGDLETAAASLVLSGSSSNPALVPDASIVFGGSGASRTVAVTPLAGQTGTATITVTVNDGAAPASDTFVLTVSAVTTPTYLFSENFEGIGYENTGWIESGTPNEDYTTTVLSGAQSLNCNGAQSIQRPFNHGASFNGYFQARWITYSAYQPFVAWIDPDWNLVIEMYCNNAGGPLTLCHGGVCATGTTPLNTGTTYHFWVEWTQGTGANGTLKLFVSATGIKPASPEINITTGTGGAMSQILLGPQSSGNVILDRLLVDDVPIGSNP